MFADVYRDRSKGRQKRVSGLVWRQTQTELLEPDSGKRSGKERSVGRETGTCVPL